MTTSFKRVSIMGAGAMGAACASMFHDSDPGCVSLVATGKRAERLKEKGLIHDLFSPEQESYL